jgi:predicted dehydrogenase
MEAVRTSKLGVGVIGCGWAGRQHARAYTLLRDRVELVAAADVDEEKARLFAQEWGFSSWHRDYREVLSNPRVEAVSICLPVYLHAEVSVEAAEAEKHVLCEKPMAGTLEEADEMIRAAGRSGVKLMIAETVRFKSVNLKLKEMLEEGAIGEVFLVRIFRDHEMHEYIRARPWMLDKRKAAGGIWMAGGIHDVDALRMLIGEVEAVSLFQAKSVIPEMEGDDTSAALLKFVNGAVGVVTESFSTKTFRRTSPLGCPFIINGTLGTITVHQDEIELYGEKTGVDRCLRIKVPANDPFLEETKHFIECIKKDTEPITSGKEERKSLAVILAGYESLKKGGAPVKVKYKNRAHTHS